jgi:hypothetical protein
VTRQCGEVGNAGMGDDQLRLVRVHQACERVGDRRQAATAVDQDRHPAVGCELEDRREPLVVEQELLRARMQLDPAGAAVEAARRLLDRALRQVEADEGHELAAASLRKGERAVVGGAEARVPVGLVEAEHERARDPVRPLDPQQLVEIAAHAVDVGAEMDVRVEDLGPRRQLRAHELLEALDKALRAPKDVLHEPESTATSARFG